MQRLFLLLLRARIFLVFIFLEVICFALIVNFNSFQGTAFYNSSNRVSGSILSVTSGIQDYFGLVEGNMMLADDNAHLHDEVISLKQELVHLDELKAQNLLLKKQLAEIVVVDSNAVIKVDTLQANLASPFKYIPAKIISNSVSKSQNYITINKGSSDDIEPGMAVVGTDGIVGKVKFVSQNYSTIKSVLHVTNNISVKFRKNGVPASLGWAGGNYKKAKLNLVQRQYKVEVGDSIVTSGFNSVYPPGVLVGTVSSASLEESESFYDVDVALINDVSKLNYVYVIKSNRRKELDELGKRLEEEGE